MSDHSATESTIPNTSPFDGLMERVDAEIAERRRRALEPRYHYRRSIVTFVDILGFRELVRSQTADHIGRILDTFGVVAEGDVDNDELPTGLSRAIKFSDNIVRVCPIDSPTQLGALFYELISLVHIQMELASLGVFIRGGVTVGDIYIGEGKIFGPAMVRAYDLESKFAIFPRIVVDPLVFEAYANEPAMQGGAHDRDHDIRYLTQVLTESDDQLQFVDYLRATPRELDEHVSYLEFLSTHREHIISAARPLNTFNNAKQKYSWLAKYHNAVVTDLVPQTDRAPLLIDLRDLGSFATG